MSPRKEVLADGVEVWLGDCREVLPLVGRVDAVVTDPPYFLPVQAYVGKRGSGYTKPMIGDISVLEGYFEGVFSLIDRALTNRNTYYVFCDAKSYPVFWRVLFPRCKHVRLLIWDKMISYNGYTWRHQHELIAWGECDGANRVPTGDGDIISVRGVKQDARFHPAEKPTGVLERLLHKLPVQSTVLDPFMGSGSSGVACVNLSRKFIGIEIEPSFFDIARRRIDEALSLRTPVNDQVEIRQAVLF